MSDLSSLLIDITQTAEWAELSAMISARSAPQALAAIIPAELMPSFLNVYARRVLCESGTGTDNCVSCASWAEDGHPDLVVAGSDGGAPGVSECLALQSQMSLKPVVAPGRLGLIPAAESLSLPAANSLLKITEEPPENAHLLFLAEEDNLIQTIRSRVWMVRFNSLEGSAHACPPPEAILEWAEWIERSRKKSLDELSRETDSWTRWFSEQGEWRMAASLANVMYISKKRHMPVSMVQDALTAILREGVRSEQIFGNLRET
ncbi:MAG: hypothetical protein LBQ58_01395 [Synergistaceae bacterium]|jgi:DNA polymerase-3 subunit delta'|nr:hypothetical protein [Synergistaceae bacterium]